MFPAGSPVPTASNLNWTASGATVANAAVGNVGADGKVGVFASRKSDVIIDVSGYFTDS
jgi:hypothetical protein